MNIRQRIPVYLLALSFAGGVAILQREDYRGEAYIPTKGDVPTLGYGSTEGVKLGELVAKLRAIEGLDQRWVSIGATDLQTGLMALTRGVAQPTTF